MSIGHMAKRWKAEGRIIYTDGQGDNLVEAFQDIPGDTDGHLTTQAICDEHNAALDRKAGKPIADYWKAIGDPICQQIASQPASLTALNAAIAEEHRHLEVLTASMTGRDAALVRLAVLTNALIKAANQ